MEKEEFVSLIPENIKTEIENATQYGRTSEEIIDEYYKAFINSLYADISEEEKYRSVFNNIKNKVIKLKVKPKFADSVEESPAEQIYNDIKEVWILTGRVSIDDVIWEIHIRDKVIKVPVKKLDTQRVFREEYLNVFYKPAPKVTSPKVWNDLITQIYENKAVIIEAPEESDEVCIARQIFEKLCSMNISDDADDALTGKALYNYQGEYYIKAAQVWDIVTNMKCNISRKVLSTTLYELGLKSPGTKTVRMGDTTKRCWGLVPQKVNEVRGA